MVKVAPSPSPSAVEATAVAIDPIAIDPIDPGEEKITLTKEQQIQFDADAKALESQRKEIEADPLSTFVQPTPAQWLERQTLLARDVIVEADLARQEAEASVSVQATLKQLAVDALAKLDDVTAVQDLAAVATARADEIIKGGK